MAKHVNTQIDIDAPAHIVWEILADFDRIAEWNDFIRHIEGGPKVGNKLVVEVWVGDRKPMTFKPTLLAYEPERELRWLGRFLLPRLADGEHRFVIEKIADDRVRFVHSETFRGLLIPLMFGGMKDDLHASFDHFNAALKQRAEARWVSQQAGVAEGVGHPGHGG
jgi:hypothetical protein